MKIKIISGVREDEFSVHKMRCVRIRDLPRGRQKQLRTYLSVRCGGADMNILKMQGERGHVALVGNVLDFLKSTDHDVKVVCDDDSDAQWPPKSWAWSALVIN